MRDDLRESIRLLIGHTGARRDLLSAVSAVAVMALLFAAPAAHAGPIVGITAAQSAYAVPEQDHPMSRDDYNYASTIPITFLDARTALFNTANTNWGGAALNLVFAGDASAVGKMFKPIDPGDFNVKIYSPWVVNSNNTTGFITGNDSVKQSRGVTNQDAGGANIVVQYTPTAAGDPKQFNFLQAVRASFSSDGTERPVNNLSLTIFDNGGGTTSPYYNFSGTGGVGNTANNTVPLDTTPAAPAGGSGWMLDIPYACESGSNGTGEGCPLTTPANDGILNRFEAIFDLYIESDFVDPTTGDVTQVLYGGIEWGVTYINADPEPGTLVLILAGVIGLGLARRRAPAARAQR